MAKSRWQIFFNRALTSTQIFIILLGPVFLMGQSFQQTADSLVVSLSTVKNLKEKVDLLNEISYAYRRIDGAVVLDYGKQAYDLAKENNYTRGKAIARKNQGIGHYKLNSPIDTTKFYYLQAIQFADQCNDFYTQAACNNNIALLHNQRQELYTSIQYYLKGIEIFDKHFKEDKRLKALMLANASVSYQSLDDNENALFYIEKAFEIAKRKNYRSILSIYAHNYGKVLTNLEQYEKARIVFESGLEINDELQDFMSKTWLLNQYANLEIILGNVNHAEELAKSSFALAIQKNIASNITYSRLSLAKINLGKENYIDCIKQCEVVIQEAQKIERITYEQQARKLLSQALEKSGNVRGALDQSRIYQAIRDSVLKNEKIVYTEELNTRYRSEEREQAIKFLKKEKTLQKKYINGLFLFSIISIIGGLFILYLLYKTRSKEKVINEKNQELKKYIDYNLELENFAYIASHDMKTPLRTIVSFAQILNSKASGKLNDSEKEYLSFIIKGTKEMSVLINDLLKFSKVNREKIKQEKIDVQQFIDDILFYNKSYLDEKLTKIDLDINTPYIVGDKTKLGQVFQNLILNGVKFHKKNELPQLSISSQTMNNEVLFEIRDNGIGIEKDYFDRIFLIFKKLNRKEEYEGSGIGLSICKKVVEMHNGKIWVNSSLEKGTSFFFTLPTSLN